jgi:hypothetical protein
LGVAVEALSSAFLFGNFFFALIPSKKKWINDNLHLKSVPLTIDTETSLSLFSLPKEAHSFLPDLRQSFASQNRKRKSFAKKKCRFFCAHAARAPTFKKVGQNDHGGRCEDPNQTN